MVVVVLLRTLHSGKAKPEDIVARGVALGGVLEQRKASLTLEEQSYSGNV